MLDSPTKLNSEFKELTMMCSDSDELTVHLKHALVGEDSSSIDDFLTYRVPVKTAKRFMRNGDVDYRSMHDILFANGYDSRERKNFIQNYHGLYDRNGPTCFNSRRDLIERMEKFLYLCKRANNADHIAFICFNSYVMRAFASLIKPFAAPKWGYVIVCLNSIPPLKTRSSFYDFRRCVLHMPFPRNYSNSILDRDPCSKALMRELYISNFEFLLKQLRLFFDRCQAKYFPKKDSNLSITNDFKSIFLTTELSPEVLQELLSDVANRKSVCVDVKRDVLTL